MPDAPEDQAPQRPVSLRSNGDAGAATPLVATGTSLVPVPAAELEPDPDPGARDPDVRMGDVDAWGRSERMREIARTVYDPLYRYWFRAEWEGLEHIPREGGALLVANHAAAIPSDAPVIMHGIEKELERPGLRAGREPAPGAARHRHDVVARRRRRRPPRQRVPPPARRPAARARVPRGHEGHRASSTASATSCTASAGAGSSRSRCASGVPVVPIAVVGAEESMPIVWKSGRLAKLLNIPYFPVTANMLAFGPLGLVGYFPAKFKLRVLAAGALRRAARPGALLARAGSWTRPSTSASTIQEALYDMLRTRRSVWFG